jgi:ATP-dependent Zn protease
MIVALSVLGFLAGVVFLANAARRLLLDDEEDRVKDSKAVDNLECRLAVHEAGHAVIAWCCTIVPSVKVATVEDPMGGMVLYTCREPKEPEAAWCRAVIALAGVAAEAHVYGRWKTRGSEGDISKALAFVREIGPREVAPPWMKIGEAGSKVPDFGKLFHGGIGALERERMKEAYRMARKIVATHGGDYFRLVSALLAMKTTSEVHLEKILGKRRVVALSLFGADVERTVKNSSESRLFKARFVLPFKRSIKRAA